MSRYCKHGAIADMCMVGECDPGHDLHAAKDAVVEAIRKIEHVGRDTLNPEALLLLALAAEAQATGRMPDLSRLNPNPKPKPVCSMCAGQGGRWTGDPTYHSHAWVECECQSGVTL